MGIDPLSVNRKRYRAVRTLRLIAVLAIGFHLWFTAYTIVFNLTNEYGDPVGFDYLINHGIRLLPTLLIAGGLGFLAPLLARWMMPSTRLDRCPVCRHEVKGAEADRCQECGAILPPWIVR